MHTTGAAAPQKRTLRPFISDLIRRILQKSAIARSAERNANSNEVLLHDWNEEKPIKVAFAKKRL